MTPRPTGRLVDIAAVVILATLVLDLAVLASLWGGRDTETSRPASSIATVPMTTTTGIVPTTSTTATATTTVATTGTTVPVVTTSTTTPAADAVLLAAGDIASCGSSGDERTASLLAARPAAVVATLGDNAYDRGAPAEFASCYAPSWGASKPRTRPATGNHDYGTAGAAGYFGYFGPAAGDATTGYYSYEVGAWHVVALNSNCWVVSCAAGSAQEKWLRADLAAHPTACTLAYWHHPRFSSGRLHGPTTMVAPLWQALYDGGAEVVMAGHEHNYERFAPLNPSGALDPARGVRSFVVGTGGYSHYPFGPPTTGSEVRNNDTFGVLQLTLKTKGLNWQFLPEPGRTFTDTGSATCH